VLYDLILMNRDSGVMSYSFRAFCHPYS